MSEDGFKQSYKDTRKAMSSLSVYNSGRQKCAPGYAWGPAVRDHYLLHYVASGHGEYTTGGQTWRLGPGDAFLAFAQTLIQYQADAQQPWTYHWVGFMGADAPHLIAATAFTPENPVLYGLDRRFPVEARLRAIYDRRGPGICHATGMTGELYLLLSELIRHVPAAIQPRSQQQAYYEVAMDYIGANYMTDISIPALAKHVGLSRSQLFRVFQSVSGQSPSAYLTKRRMAASLPLLKDKTLTVSQVAASVGYPDPLYFSRVFRENMGISPSRWRELN